MNLVGVVGEGAEGIRLTKVFFFFSLIFCRGETIIK